MKSKQYFQKNNQDNVWRCFMKKLIMLLFVTTVAFAVHILLVPSVIAQTVNDPLFNQQSYLSTINISGAWGLETGASSIKIGILAPGGVYSTHEDLSSRVTIKHQSSIQGFLPLGTITAGIAGAATNNNLGISGINWNSPIYSYDAGKVETFNYELNEVQYSEDYFVLDTSGLPNRISSIRNDQVDILITPFHLTPTQHSPNITSSKFQLYPDLAPPQVIHYLQTSHKNVTSLFRIDQHLTDYTNAMLALKEAYKDDITIIAPMPEYDGVLRGLPANLNADRISIAVGSTNIVGDTPFQYSAYGESSSNIHSPEVDIVAPGVNILTTLNTGTDQYTEVTTTTASSGIVSGVASLLKSNNPDLKPDDIREILRRTADAMGPNDYDPKTGFGRVNAQAAMQYLQDNTITHGELTDVNTTKIQSNQQKTLINGAWGNLASGTYSVDVYEVKGTVDLPSGQEDVWYRANGTTGWSLANPNFQRRFALVDIDESSKKATFTTFVYHVKYNSIGQSINEWHPIHKDQAQIAYTLAGDPVPPPPPPPPSVSISGPSNMFEGTTDTFTANVSGGTPPYSFQWYYRHESSPNWMATGSNSSTYSHTAGSPNGEYVRVVVTDSYPNVNEDIHYFTIIGMGFSQIDEESNAPETFELTQNYPNPFNPSTAIRYDIPEQSEVVLQVFDVMGRLVATLESSTKSAGSYTATFDASNLSSGLYLA